MHQALSRLPLEQEIRSDAEEILAKHLRAAELIAVILLVLIQLWMPQGKSRIPIWIAGMIVFGEWVFKNESWENLGLINTRWTVLVSSLFLIKFALGKAFSVQDHIGDQLAVNFIGYFPWALLQEMVLNAFFAERLREHVDENRLPWVVGGIFAAVHAPNPVLMPVAFFGGTAASRYFLHIRKNIYVIALAHAVVGVVLFRIVPTSWDHHLLVGLKFFRSH